ncbi:hypothetical protein DFP72DRAFT_941790 [Ephemerocybe angulata]|uniref:T6SS Phospholipase effector Tle1-like catalytic domain-containing protein n=1 Tax=Ephemerocybe angulata TaxID=980116 RepID=A0A8H6H7A8_9AGAR|nr:hypothetical protein DFP72DRAFT_941790 [Tulosesus angulatus]
MCWMVISSSWQNYSHGDKICLFGFSRGAYTARRLCRLSFGSLVIQVGLLPRDNHAQMPFAFKLYKREDQAGLNLCAGFKRTYCHRVTVEFVGVWDTVASVGALMGRTLPFTNSNSSIRTFRHALALDEHRARYRPNMWHRAPPKVKAPVFSRNVEAPPEHVLPPRQNSESSASSEEEVVSKPQKRMNIFKRAFAAAGTDPEKAAYASVRDDKGRIPRNATDGSNDVLEVWFSGCHSGKPEATQTLLIVEPQILIWHNRCGRWRRPERREAFAFVHYATMDGSAGGVDWEWGQV